MEMKVVKVTVEQFDKVNDFGTEYEPFYAKLDRALLSKKKPAQKKTEAPTQGTQSPIAQVGRAFKEAYLKKFKHEYSGWGAKENGQVKNWLGSVPLSHALELCRIYPNWTDPYAVSNGHTLSILIDKYMKLWTDYKRIKEKTETIEDHKKAKQEIKDHVHIERTIQRQRAESSRIHTQGKRNNPAFQIEDDG